MDILIKADNPKGLDYEYLIQGEDAPEKAKGVIRNIAARGGKNMTINGRPLPAETLEFIRNTEK